MSLFLISQVSSSFAHESIKHNLRVTTDQSSYAEGEIITISVDISEYEGGTITIQIWKDGDIIDMNQGEVTYSGDSEVTYSYITIAEGPSWTQGTYVARAEHHSIVGEALFNVGNSEIKEKAPEQTTGPPKKRITIRMDETIFYLDSQNKIIRGIVEIENYIPSDGRFFMKITHVPTNKVLKDFQIFPKPSENDLWAIPIAYPILESDLKLGNQMLFGEFEINIRTEFGVQTATSKFFIFESQDDQEPKTKIDSSSGEPASGQSDQSFQNIPEWIKTNAEWWSNDRISETEFLRAIEYLIKNDIMKISINENLPQFTTTYSLPSKYSTEFVEINGSLPEKHQGAITLTLIKPNKSEEKLTTFSRDGNFVTTIELTNESPLGIYQVFAEINNGLIPISTFNVKIADSPTVPPWIKNNAGWWSQDLITDDDFVKGIQYLVEQRIIIV